MGKASYVVVFPTPFARGRIPALIDNIEKILKIRGLGFGSVRRDGDVVLVDASDPVFASSAIGLLFGTEKIVIARQVRNDFEEIVSEIVETGGNLLLRGERFLVRVDGAAKGFVTKDVELAATSGIIEKKSGLGALPGTDARHDRLLYARLTEENAYVSIFSDAGSGGVPRVEGQGAVCAIYDEISAVSCYETIRQGYDARIVVCYRRKSELLGLAKMINRIIPRLVRESIELEFFHIKGGDSYLSRAGSIFRLLLRFPDGRVSLPLSPLIFPQAFIDRMLGEVFGAGKVPLLPLAGAESGIFDLAARLGLGSDGDRKRLERFVGAVRKDGPEGAGVPPGDGVRIAIRTGPNNVHDILDSLENH